MNYNQLRPYIAVTMMVALVLLATTGGILFFAPQGPDSRVWSCLGLSKHQFKDIHLSLGIMMAILATIHGFFNFSSMSNYLKHNSKVWAHPLLWALVVVFITAIMALRL
jgi:cytochrome b subunit of formate dehydrogenase